MTRGNYGEWDVNSPYVYYPKFITVVNILCLILLIVRTLALLAAWGFSLYEGSLLTSPLLEQQTGHPIFWIAWNTCTVIAAWFVSVFMATCIAAVLAWSYRCIKKLSPVPRSYVDATVRRLSILSWVLIGYGLVYSGLTIGGLVSFITRLIEDGRQNDMAMGMLVLVSPFLFVFCVGVAVIIIGFCVMLVPGGFLVRKMVNYVRRPSIYKVVLEGESIYE